MGRRAIKAQEQKRRQSNIIETCVPVQTVIESQPMRKEEVLPCSKPMIKEVPSEVQSKDQSESEDELQFLLEIAQENIDATLIDREEILMDTSIPSQNDFYLNLKIPNNFWDSPAVSPMKGKYDFLLKTANYNNFFYFLEHILYPELSELTALMQDSQIENKEANQQEYASINYKILNELYTISENIIQYKDCIRNNMSSDFFNKLFELFEFFENFMKNYDAIFDEIFEKSLHTLSRNENFFWENQIYNRIDADQMLRAFSQIVKQYIDFYQQISSFSPSEKSNHSSFKQGLHFYFDLNLGVFTLKEKAIEKSSARDNHQDVKVTLDRAERLDNIFSGH